MESERYFLFSSFVIFYCQVLLLHRAYTRPGVVMLSVEGVILGTSQKA